MSDVYYQARQQLNTITDFLRFSLSQAHAHPVYYGHGTDNAWDDMHALILDTLGLARDLPLEFFQARLLEEEKNMLCSRIKRRIIDRVPVPYLTNKAYFCELPFYVDERVLIPRSPIAELINQQFAPWVSEDRVTRILDLCTGSGCIAIAGCYAFPDALVDAVDISKAALEVANLNRKEHGLQDRLTLIESNCFAAVPAQTYDIIVSNPPYVSTEEMQTLPEEYYHEPKLALEADKEGLSIVETILHQARHFLSEDGILVVEVGNSEEALIEAYPHVPFTWLEFEHGGQGVFLLTYQQLEEYFG